MFQRSGGAWLQQAKLIAQDGAAGDHFGESVAISGETIVVGATGDDHGKGRYAGSLYVFASAREPIGEPHAPGEDK